MTQLLPGQYRGFLLRTETSILDSYLERGTGPRALIAGYMEVGSVNGGLRPF